MLMSLRKNIKMTPLGSDQFYHLMYYLEKYHYSYQSTLSFKNCIIQQLDATIYQQWDHPMIVFKNIKNNHNLVLGYDKVIISSEEYEEENLVNLDSYFNVSLHFDLPPHEDLIKLQQLMNIGFGIVLPWTK